jgi:hypothetical protein
MASLVVGGAPISRRSLTAWGRFVGEFKTVDELLAHLNADD